MTHSSQGTDTDHAAQDSVPPPPGETLGHFLQHARLNQSITLESVAAETRIHSTTIQALENDDYENLPAEVFVRGFIKIYATHLGLDPQHALSLHQPHPDNNLQGYSGRQDPVQPQILAGEYMGEAPPLSVGKQLLIILIILIAAALGYRAYKTYFVPAETKRSLAPLGESFAPSSLVPPPDPTVTKPEPEADAPTQPEAAPPTAAATTPAAATTTEAEAAPAAQPTENHSLPVIAPTKRKQVFTRPSAAAEPAADQVQVVPPPESSRTVPTQSAVADAYVLTADFTELTWLQVRIDEQAPREYTFRAGEQWQWRASNGITLQVGNAGGTHLTLNGKQLPPLGASGAKVELTLPREAAVAAAETTAL